MLSLRGNYTSLKDICYLRLGDFVAKADGWTEPPDIRQYCLTDSVTPMLMAVKPSSGTVLILMV